MILRILAALVAAIALVVIVLAMRVLEPIISVPGGTLAGTEEAAPLDWSFTAAIDTVQLETQLDDPYSVNLWGLGIGPDFYVATNETGTGWTDIVDGDPDVKLRVGDSVYRLSAVRVVDDDELQRVLDGYVTKYSMGRAELEEVMGRAYRLDRP